MRGKRAAFTLAEVLITLGIIGVVAAMTMPALMSHYKKQEASARLKKFYSTMSQAIQMAENEYGPIKDWEYAEDMDDDGNLKSNAENKENLFVFFNRYLKPYIKYIEIDENPKDLIAEDAEDTPDIRVYLPDSSYINMDLGACVSMVYDVNGLKGPNEHGRDKFHFVLCSGYHHGYDAALRHCGANRYFCGYAGTGVNSRSAALDVCKRKSTNCTKLLMMDGWEFRPDYPWKL